MKVKLTVWVEKPVADAIRDGAARRERTLSEHASDLLEHAVEANLEEPVGAAVFMPEVLGAVRREIALRLEPVETLATRAALEADAGRRALFQLLAHHFGAEAAQRMHRAAWGEAASSLEKARGKTG